MGGKRFAHGGETYEREMAAIVLRTSGFTNYEVRQILDAKDAKGRPQPIPDLKNQAWRDAMIQRQLDRGQLIGRLRKQGIRPSARVLDNVFDVRYRTSKTAKPWDYVQAESLKGARKTTVDYQKVKYTVKQMRAKKRIKADQQRRLKLVIV